MTSLLAIHGRAYPTAAVPDDLATIKIAVQEADAVLRTR
jgi:hypothetical protein